MFQHRRVVGCNRERPINAAPVIKVHARKMHDRRPVEAQRHRPQRPRQHARNMQLRRRTRPHPAIAEHGQHHQRPLLRQRRMLWAELQFRHRANGVAQPVRAQQRPQRPDNLVPSLVGGWQFRQWIFRRHEAGRGIDPVGCEGVQVRLQRLCEHAACAQLWRRSRRKPRMPSSVQMSNHPAAGQGICRKFRHRSSWPRRRPTQQAKVFAGRAIQNCKVGKVHLSFVFVVN